MSLDYNLVIIGNTLEAYYAALEAVKLKARVALVLGNRSNIQQPEIDRFIVHYFTYLDQHYTNLIQWPIHNKLEYNFDIKTILQWKNQVKQDIERNDFLNELASLGVDIIYESGEFCRLPKLGFVLRNRTLRSHRYLLAMGSISTIPNIQGLSEGSYITSETLELDKLPQNLVILSQNPLGIELAQQLNYLGKDVTLIVENSSILPEEDRDIMQLIEARLEAEGIKLLINCTVSKVREIEDTKWIQAGNEAIETEAIILITDLQPNIKGLNLKGVKVEKELNKIKTNNKLQTTNPSIYACGSIIGGYNLSNISQYEGSVAVKNALFYPIFKVNYHYHPFRIFTNPILSRVGLTETQARQRYGDDLIVLKENYKALVKAKNLDETVGFCKIITRENGTILGCHIIGNNSDEIINLVALAMKNRIKIQQFSKIFPHYSTNTEILFKVSEHWKQQKLESNHLLNDCLETLLFWRRKWNK
ncbi:MAG: NAD(P)/FAD-dependent oxidoreductase [Crocosphaera sp.]